MHHRSAPQKCRHRRTFLLCHPKTSRQVLSLSMAISSAQPADSASSHAAGRPHSADARYHPVLQQNAHRRGKCIRCSGRRCIAGHNGGTAAPAIPASTASPLKTGSHRTYPAAYLNAGLSRQKKALVCSLLRGRKPAFFSVVCVRKAFPARAIPCCSGSVAGAEISVPALHPYPADAPLPQAGYGYRRTGLPCAAVAD